MDIKEFVFRHMHGTQTGRFTSDRPNSTEVPRPPMNAPALNDPEAVELCAQFLYQEIFLEGKTPDRGVMYPWAHFEALAKEFIEDIIPSDTFMHDALTFFNEIREGKR